MDIKKFSDMLLQGIKIGRREPEQEETFLEMEDEDNKIHEIYERFANSWEYDLIMSFCFGWGLNMHGRCLWNVQKKKKELS